MEIGGINKYILLFSAKVSNAYIFFFVFVEAGLRNLTVILLESGIAKNMI